MKIVSMILAFILAASPMESFAALRASPSPAQARFKWWLADLLKSPPSAGTEMEKPPVLQKLSEFQLDQDGQIDGIRLEKFPEEAEPLFQVLERENFPVEDLVPWEMTRKNRERFLSLVRLTEDEVNARYDDLARALEEGTQEGDTDLAHAGIYALREISIELQRERLFLSEERRLALPSPRLKIAKAVQAFEERVETFNAELEKKIASEELYGTVYDDWFYKDPLGNKWHTRDLGPAVAFETFEDAVQDRGNSTRALGAPGCPFRAPIVRKAFESKFRFTS